VEEQVGAFGGQRRPRRRPGGPIPAGFRRRVVLGGHQDLGGFLGHLARDGIDAAVEQLRGV
jgi:hypothetical protein